MAADARPVLPPYPVTCTAGCGRPALYKVAAQWSDGHTAELKTYSLCCAECLPPAFRAAAAKQQACRRAAGEALDPPGIYPLRRGDRDRALPRLYDLESELSRGAGAD